MKSGTPREYLIEGKPYKWDRLKFIDRLAQMREDVDGIKKRIPQIKVFDAIADILDVTPDAVKHWKNGDNSPVSLEYVKVCAEVLGVGYLDLLSPSYVEEMNKMTEKEVALVEKVFDGCVNSYYVYSERFNEHAGDSNQRHEVNLKYKEKALSMIDDMHSVVDRNSLFVSEDIRYRIHRFLNVFREDFDLYDMPEEWIEINDGTTGQVEYIISTPMQYHIRYMRTHEDGVHFLGLIYLDEESDLASKLSYEYTEIPSEYYDSVNVDGESLDENGNPRDLSKFRCVNFELNPLILYKDYITRILKNAFMIEFPELKKAYR